MPEISVEPRECDANKDFINDNFPAILSTVTLAELASAMKLDEDVLLQRIAKVLRKSESATKIKPGGE